MNSAPVPSAACMMPVQPVERIPILDILRGFALFGILVVDIPGFAGPVGLPGYVPPVALPWYDALARNLVALLAEGKFYLIFSFLFGVGFALQLARAEARGEKLRSFYPRRLWLLLSLGILHAVFLWTADILRVYAALGFVLAAFRKRPNRTLLIWACFFVLLSAALQILGRASTGEGNTAIPGIDVVGMARAAYHSPSYVDVLIFQALSFPASSIISFLTRGPIVMALFLLGLAAGRSRLLEQLPDRREVLRRVFCISLVVGLAGSGLVLLGKNHWPAGLGSLIGSPGLASAYVSGLALLSLTARGARALAPLGKAGRMALSNYLLQSIACTLLFDGFGFALYEKVDQAGLLAMATLIYLAQIPFSVWWLRQFEFGPVEWLWRSLTYRRRQPFRRVDLLQPV